MKKTILKSIITVILSFSIVISFSSLYAQNMEKETTLQMEEFKKFKQMRRTPFSRVDSKKTNPALIKKPNGPDESEKPNEQEESKSLGVYTTATFNITKFSSYRVNCGGKFTIYGYLGNQQTANGIKSVALVKDYKLVRLLSHSNWTNSSVKATIPYGMDAGRYYITIIERTTNYQGTRPPDRFCTNLPMDILQSKVPNLSFSRVTSGVTNTRIGLKSKIPTLKSNTVPMMKEFGYVIGRLNFDGNDVIHSPHSPTSETIQFPIKIGIKELYGKDVNFKIKFYVYKSGYKLNREINASIKANQFKYYTANLVVYNPGSNISIKTVLSGVTGDPNIYDNKTVDNIEYTP